MTCVCVGFSSIRLLLHFNNDTGCGIYNNLLWYEIGTVFLICCPSLHYQAGFWVTLCMYLGKCTHSAELSSRTWECILKQNLRVHRVHAFSVFVCLFCIFGLDSTQHSGVCFNVHPYMWSQACFQLLCPAAPLILASSDSVCKVYNSHTAYVSPYCITLYCGTHKKERELRKSCVERVSWCLPCSVLAVCP